MNGGMGDTWALGLDDVEQDIKASESLMSRVRTLQHPPVAGGPVGGLIGRPLESLARLTGGMLTGVSRGAWGGLGSESILENYETNRLGSLLPGVSRGLLRSVIAVERTRMHDRLPLVISASVLLEQVLVPLVVDFAAPVADLLCAAVPRNRSPWMVLEAWSTKGLPPTMVTVEVILLAARRAVEKRDEHLSAAVERQFGRGYISLLRSRGFEACLREIRERFRNPAAHGRGAFSNKDAERLTQLSVGRPSWAAWASESRRSPGQFPTHEAVMHHHLANLRSAPGPA